MILGARFLLRRLLVGEGAAGRFEIAVHLVPDVGELGLDQLRRRLERVGGVELVEQLALDLLARHRAELALDLAAHDLAQALERFEAEILGGLVVDLELAGLRHFLDGDVEGRFLAGQIGGVVVFREGHGDQLLVAGLGADQLVLEARDELLRAEHQRLVGAGAAVEGLAVDLADIVDGDAVAVFGLALLRLVGARRFGDALDLLVDLRFRHVEDRPRHRDAGEILDLDRRNDLIGELELEIGAAGEDLLGFLLVLGHGDLGLHGGLLAAVGDDGAGRVGEDLVDHLGHERLAVDLAQVLDRHLAGAEAVDADLVLGVGKPRHQLGFHVAGRHGDLDLALQTGIQRLGNLHHQTFVFTNAAAQTAPAVQPAGMSRAGVAFGAGLRAPVADGLPTANETLRLRSKNASKSLFFLLLTTFVRSGPSYPVTIDTPFVTGRR